MEGFGLDTQEDLFEQLYCVQSQKNRNKLAKRLIERVDSLGFLQKVESYYDLWADLRRLPAIKGGTCASLRA